MMQLRFLVLSTFTAAILSVCAIETYAQADPESPPASPTTAIIESGPYTHKDGWCFNAVGSGLTLTHASGGWREVWAAAPPRIPQHLVRKVRVTLDQGIGVGAGSAVCVMMGNDPKLLLSDFAHTGVDGGPDEPFSPLCTSSGTVCGCETSGIGFNDGGVPTADLLNKSGEPLRAAGAYVEFNIARDLTSSHPSAPPERPPYLWVGNGAATTTTGVCVDVWW
jgi:hypothetical protein